MADGEQGFLGLTHNPFTADDDTFFAGGDRKVYLDQLRHLSQWSRSVTLVTGPQGVGKTMLYRQLSMTLEPRVKAARINGMLVNTARDVLGGVVQGFGASASTDGNLQMVSGAITTFVINQDRQGRFCLVMVDDAHLLAHQALEELLKLSKSSPVRVLLFGEQTIVGMVAKSAERLEAAWHEIRLTGYSQTEMEDYLVWRLAQAEYTDKLPFSMEQVAKLHRLSAGLPGQVNRVAGDLLERIESGQADEEQRFPLAHRLLVVLIVAVIGLAYLVFSDSEAKREQSAREIAKVERIELPSPDDDASADDGRGATEGVSEQTDRDADETAPDTTLADVQETSETETVDVPPASSGSVPSEERGLDDAALQAQIAEEETLARSNEPAEPVREEPVPVEESAPAASVSALTESREPVSASGARDADWLLAQDAGGYTMQLVTVSSMGRADTFLQQQREPSLFATYPIQRDGKTLYVITYGVFADKATADQAATQLPAEVGNLTPWVRPMRLVQDAVRANR